MKKKASKKAKKSSYIKVRDLKPDKNPKGGFGKIVHAPYFGFSKIERDPEGFVIDR
jgi:hypothetical protein